jgi:flagellar basal-body rod protein FlgG
LIRGLYTSATGMLSQQKRMDTITNNIANVDTTGFKKDAVATRAFDEVLTRRLNDKTQIEGERLAMKIGGMSLGTYVDQVYTDFSVGTLDQTDNDLDLALDKQGFFAISYVDKDGKTTEKYTRDGSFTTGPDGVLMTEDGYKVLGENGAIELPAGFVTINELGEVYVNSQYIDKLKVVNFENMDSLRKFGDNLTDATADTKKTPYTGKVMQGFLEGSNVNSVQEMVNMIASLRAYEVNQKMIQIHDSTLGKAVNEIGTK